MKNKIEDIDRVVKLINEYTQKLKELLDLYHTQKKRRMMLISYGGIIFIILYIFLFSYLTNYNFNKFLGSSGVLILIIALFGLLVFISYFMVNFYKESRNRTDIVDEIVLNKKQLSHLISIGSQYREHLIYEENDFLILEFDLKLTEAENVISRAKRIQFVKRAEESNKASS